MLNITGIWFDGNLYNYCKMTYLDIFIFAGFAVFLAFKLKTLLGRVDEDMPFGGPAASPVIEAVAEEEPQSQETVPQHLEEAVAKARKIESRFTLSGFLKGASAAFEIILKAFSEGNREKLKTLLGGEVYGDFEKQISERESEGKTQSTTLVALKTPEVQEITLQKALCRIKVRFDSEQINLVKDKEGKILEGNPSRINRISDLWTFERELGSRNPNWKLVEI